MKTKIILVLAGVALVAAALVGVSTAQYVGSQNRNGVIQTPLVPPCADASGTLPQYCFNATNGEPYCYSNQTRDGYCQNNTGAVGGCSQGGYGCGAQEQNMRGFGAGMMGQTGNIRGHCR